MLFLPFGVSRLETSMPLKHDDKSFQDLLPQTSVFGSVFSEPAHTVRADMDSYHCIDDTLITITVELLQSTSISYYDLPGHKQQIVNQ